MQQNRKQSNLNRYSKLLGILMLGIAEIAMAKDIGQVATTVSGSFNALAIAAQAFFALCGICMIGMSIFTFIKYNKTDGQGAKLSTAFVYLIGGGLLFFIASLVETTGDTMWGAGAGNRTKINITN